MLKQIILKRTYLKFKFERMNIAQNELKYK